MLIIFNLHSINKNITCYPLGVFSYNSMYIISFDIQALQTVFDNFVTWWLFLLTFCLHYADKKRENDNG